MSFLSALALAQSATATATVVLPAPLPHSAAAAVSAYQDCLMDVIDAQDRRAVYSERAVLSACAGVRRTKYGEAIARLSDAGWPVPVSRGRVRHGFAELDESVWTIIGHIRVRHGQREGTPR